MSKDSKTKNSSLNDSLAAKMRSGWDRRVSHDYRYWMSDGVESDEEMWAVGARDFEILLSDLKADVGALKAKTAFELGCGVGRLLRPASEVFGRVIGVDVSEAAVTRAKELLADRDNVEVVLGNGLDLSAISDNTVDFAFSFAALCSMPVSVIAMYLVELNRVLKPDGLLRLQVYLGSQQQTVQEDTLAIRSFDKGRFVAAVQAAGFAIKSLEELVLGFEISDEQGGMLATMVSLELQQKPTLESSEIAEILIPGGEAAAGSSWQGSQTEYLMAIERARQLLDQGRVEEGASALEFATTYYKKPEPEVCALLEEIKSRGAGPQSHVISHKPLVPAAASSGLLEKNLEIVSQRFPELYQELKELADSDKVCVKSGASGDVVLSYEGRLLDHLDKPARAGEAWAERALNDTRATNSDAIIVAGFAGGYHLEALAEKGDFSLHVVEPHTEILRAIFSAKDCSRILKRLASLSTSVRSFEDKVVMALDAERTRFLVHPQTQAIARPEVDEYRTAFWSRAGVLRLKPSIAVVGPLYGGSLPIAAYAYRALKGLGQRVQFYDFGGFYESYKLMDSFVQDKSRRSNLQDYYVEMLSQAVLEGISEKPVDLLICLAQAPMSARVLTEIRNRGIVTAMWFVEDCRRFTTWKQIAKYFDYMFLIQRGEFEQKVEAAGAGKALYLPLACDPDIHAPLTPTPEERERWGSELSFVGAGYNNRRHTFAGLAGRDIKLWGTEWPPVPPFQRMIQENGRRIDPSEYVKIFNSSTINLNLHSSIERDGVEPYGDFVNPRTFELAACGAFQLVDNRKLLGELFDVDTEMATFSDVSELDGRIDHYLAHPEERASIVAAARKKVIEQHTYQHRMKEMLGAIYADKYEHLHQRIQGSPWTRTLTCAEDYPELHERFMNAYLRGDEPTLDSLMMDIRTGSGALTETEQRLLFLDNLRGQIRYVDRLRSGKEVA